MFVPGMSAGAPGAAPKKTLCATEPNAKVTVPPATMFTGDGLNEILGVALTVAVIGGGELGAGLATAPPHAARSVRQIKEERRSMFVSEGGRAPNALRR